MSRLILLASAFCIILVTGYVLWPEPVIRHSPGILCPDEPEQEAPEKTAPWLAGNNGAYMITPLASYRIRALVLGRKSYYDRGSDIAPVDLALGWGAMSNQAVIDQIDISQTSRFYLWRAKRLPIPADEISVQSANTHIIPGNPNVRERLDDVTRGSIVTMSGYLVRVTATDGFRWQSSLTRNDTGNGACELFWVDDMEVGNE